MALDGHSVLVASLFGLRDAYIPADDGDRELFKALDSSTPAATQAGNYSLNSLDMWVGERSQHYSMLTLSQPPVSVAGQTELEVATENRSSSKVFSTAKEYREFEDKHKAGFRVGAVMCLLSECRRGALTSAEILGDLESDQLYWWSRQASIVQVVREQSPLEWFSSARHVCFGRASSLKSAMRVRAPSPAGLIVPSPAEAGFRQREAAAAHARVIAMGAALWPRDRMAAIDAACKPWQEVLGALARAARLFEDVGRGLQVLQVGSSQGAHGRPDPMYDTNGNTLLPMEGLRHPTRGKHWAGTRGAMRPCAVRLDEEGDAGAVCTPGCLRSVLSGGGQGVVEHEGTVRIPQSGNAGTEEEDEDDEDDDLPDEGLGRPGDVGNDRAASRVHVRAVGHHAASAVREDGGEGRGEVNQGTNEANERRSWMWAFWPFDDTMPAGTAGSMRPSGQAGAHRLLRVIASTSTREAGVSPLPCGSECKLGRWSQSLGANVPAVASMTPIAGAATANDAVGDEGVNVSGNRGSCSVHVWWPSQESDSDGIPGKAGGEVGSGDDADDEDARNRFAESCLRFHEQTDGPPERYAAVTGRARLALARQTAMACLDAGEALLKAMGILYMAGFNCGGIQGATDDNISEAPAADCLSLLANELNLARRAEGMCSRRAMQIRDGYHTSRVGEQRTDWGQYASVQLNVMHVYASRAARRLIRALDSCACELIRLSSRAHVAMKAARRVTRNVMAPHSRRGFMRRNWLAVTGAASIAMVGGYMIWQRGGISMQPIRSATRGVLQFWREHVNEPLTSIANEVFRGSSGIEGGPSARDIGTAQAGLQRMLGDFYGELASGRVAVPGKPLLPASNAPALPSVGPAEVLDPAVAEELALQLDLGVVSRMYEGELKTPIRSLIAGSMPRLLLLQTEHLRLQMLRALGAMDTMLRAQHFNLQALALLPALYASVVAVGAVGGVISRVRRPVAIDKIRESLAQLVDALDREICTVITAPGGLRELFLLPGDATSSKFRYSPGRQGRYGGLETLFRGARRSGGGGVSHGSGRNTHEPADRYMEDLPLPMSVTRSGDAWSADSRTTGRENRQVWVAGTHGGQHLGQKTGSKVSARLQSLKHHHPHHSHHMDSTQLKGQPLTNTSAPNIGSKPNLAFQQDANGLHGQGNGVASSSSMQFQGNGEMPAMIDVHPWTAAVGLDEGATDLHGSVVSRSPTDVVLPPSASQAGPIAEQEDEDEYEGRDERQEMGISEVEDRNARVILQGAGMASQDHARLAKDSHLESDRYDAGTAHEVHDGISRSREEADVAAIGRAASWGSQGSNSSVSNAPWVSSEGGAMLEPAGTSSLESGFSDAALGRVHMLLVTLMIRLGELSRARPGLRGDCARAAEELAEVAAAGVSPLHRLLALRRAKGSLPILRSKSSTDLGDALSDVAMGAVGLQAILPQRSRVRGSPLA